MMTSSEPWRGVEMDACIYVQDFGALHLLQQEVIAGVDDRVSQVVRVRDEPGALEADRNACW